MSDPDTEQAESSTKEPKELYSKMREQLGHSVHQVNHVMISWLASLGTAFAAQSDDHLELGKSKAAKKRSVYSQSD